MGCKPLYLCMQKEIGNYILCVCVYVLYHIHINDLTSDISYISVMMKSLYTLYYFNKKFID